MGIDIETADAASIGPDRWDRLVERSPQGTFFHQYAALELQADHAGAELHRLVGLKGQEPVGLFPAFELRKGPITGVFSPPPRLWVPTLGPAMVNVEKLSRRKRDRRIRAFIEGSLDWFTDRIGAQYVNVSTDDRLRDLRPFKWTNCSVVPEFTYVVDLTRTPDEVRSGFSGDARNNIRNCESAGDSIELTEADAEGAALILERVRERYAEQGVPFTVAPEFGAELYRALPEGQLRPYVCRVDGAFAGGILAVEYGDTVGRWMGGARPDESVELPVNDLLDWHVMSEAMDRGFDAYDLMGAGDPRINDYKSKFGPELRSYATVEGGTRWGRLLVDLYRKRGVVTGLTEGLSPDIVPSKLRGK
ncbi:lipid II:glycine glycyltransferase FemX [Halorarius halobius]|uniref:lipid II:glycine glycyltransferase FemX n=1 Tax=Halorarius halobius TaxID=2962671 RepID=UPI0020CCD377|nr:GNAT family N-acetyltransferase [Halorarius halobius]